MDDGQDEYWLGYGEFGQTLRLGLLIKARVIVRGDFIPLMRYVLLGSSGYTLLFM